MVNGISLIVCRVLCGTVGRTTCAFNVLSSVRILYDVIVSAAQKKYERKCGVSDLENIFRWFFTFVSLRAMRSRDRRLVAISSEVYLCAVC